MTSITFTSLFPFHIYVLVNDVRANKTSTFTFSKFDKTNTNFIVIVIPNFGGCFELFCFCFLFHFQPDQEENFWLREAVESRNMNELYVWSERERGREIERVHLYYSYSFDRKRETLKRAIYKITNKENCFSKAKVWRTGNLENRKWDGNRER